MHDGTSLNWQDKEDSPSEAKLPPAEVEAELLRILASPAFCNAPRHSRFLTFVVRKALAGEVLKEYPIGVEVFDRAVDFDPAADPVVRSEARRLRSRLAEYYRRHGALDPVHIDLPKGTYVPVFRRNGVLPDVELTKPESNLDDAGVEVGEAGREAAPEHRHREQHWIWGSVLALALCIMAAYAAHVFHSRRLLHSRLTASPNVLVPAEFTNTTGDVVFDGTLRQALSSQLEQSPYLNLLSDKSIAQTLTLMSQPKGTRLTRELAREVCQRTASTATVEGSISASGMQYVLGLTAVSCSDGKTLAEEHITADSKKQVLKALGAASTKLRRELGESLESVQKYDTPVENVTTGSLEALQAYSQGYQAMMLRDDYSTAIPLFQRAISLDPNFAMAYARFGTIYENQSQTVQAAENTRKAYELRDRVSEREKFYIDAHYYNLVTGDLEAAGKTYELWAQTYPQDGTAFGNLGVTYAVLGNYDKSLAGYQQDLKLNPESAVSYANLIYGYLSVNRPDEARALAQEAQRRHIDSPLMHAYLYYLDFLQRDVTGMELDSKELIGKPGWEDSMLYFEADTAAYAGKVLKARDLMLQATDSAQHVGEKETAASYQAISAVHEALVGNFGAAKQQAQAALGISTGKDVEAVSAIALGLAGDSWQAERLGHKLDKRFPQDTIIQFNYLPTIRAVLALRKGDTSKAIEALAPAKPYELGRGPLVWLYPIYMRGEAYLAARQDMAAAAQFQAILDRPGIVLNEPIGALAHLGLGRAYLLAGDTAKAKIAYQDFFALWKDADPGVPILRQAQAEYAKLR